MCHPLRSVCHALALPVSTLKLSVYSKSNRCIQLFVLVQFGTVIAPSCYGHIVTGAEPLDLVGFATPFGFDGTEEYTDIWGLDEYVYIGSMGSGVAILDLNSHGNQLDTVAIYPAAGGESFQDVKVIGSIGYFSGSAGTDLVDLSDPFAPSKIARIGAVDGGHSSARNAAIGDGLLYQVDPESPLIKVFDVTNSNQPSFITEIDSSDTGGIFDVSLEGDRLYAAGTGGATYLYDVHNIRNAPPLALGQVASGVGSAHVSTKQDGNTMLVSQHKLGGAVEVWDISEPAMPVLRDEADASDLGFNSYSTSEVAVIDNIAFVAWYEAGLQVLDLDELSLTGLQRLGLFNTSPDSSPLDGFVGARSVFPYLGVDRVLVSDTKWGAHVLDARFVLPTSTIPGDYDDSRIVDDRDYETWKTTFGLSTFRGDGNGDGVVDLADYTVWRNNLGSSSSPSQEVSLGNVSTIPEPRSSTMCCFLGVVWGVSYLLLTSKG